jgi:hypothetical protein
LLTAHHGRFAEKKLLYLSADKEHLGCSLDASAAIWDKIFLAARIKKGQQWSRF